MCVLYWEDLQLFCASDLSHAHTLSHLLHQTRNQIYGGAALSSISTMHAAKIIDLFLGFETCAFLYLFVLEFNSKYLGGMIVSRVQRVYGSTRFLKLNLQVGVMFESKNL